VGFDFVADGKVYVGDEDGDFVVLAAAKEKKVISETNLGAAVYGTPIVANARSISNPTRTSSPSPIRRKLARSRMSRRSWISS